LAPALSLDPYQALFLGLLLVPTSSSISAQTLMELGKLRSRVGVSLLGAAVVDDTLTVVPISLLLALFGEAASGQANGLLIVLKMPLYLVIASLVGIWLILKLGHYAENLRVNQGLVASTSITVLLYAWAAEALGGMAGIMGAFAAGLFGA
jgi:Kef-type K+ transport system membrane component KefB